MYLRATLDDGTQVVSEFSKLASAGRYSAQVFDGRKPFNGWKVVGSVHPHSGEPLLHRERRMYNGNNVRMIEEVEPTTEEHGLAPENFRPLAVPQGSHRGFYTAPTPALHDDMVEGARYPQHRDPENYRDFVILRVAGEYQSEVRYYLDGRGDSPMYEGAYPIYGREDTSSPEEDDFDDDDDPDPDPDDEGSHLGTEEDEWAGEPI